MSRLMIGNGEILEKAFRISIAMFIDRSSHFFTIKDGKIWQANLVSDLLTPLFAKGVVTMNHDVNEVTELYINKLQKMGYLPKISSQN